MKINKIFFSTRKQIGILTFLILLSLAGCKDNGELGLPPQDEIPPAPPTVIGTKNLNGAAIIYYKAPSDDDLLCVTASYVINDVDYTTKSSVYKDSLKVEGFGKKGDYTVILKSVDKSRNESTPVEVTVSPLESPVEIIFETLEVVASFGGIKVKWENANENSVIVGVSIKDSYGDWTSLENFYTNAQIGLGTIRGLDTIPITFGVSIRDRWDNHSQIFESTQIPLFEAQLDKSKFREVTQLPGDATPHGSLPVRNIWDGNTVSNCYHTAGTAGIGLFVTFDMGQLAKLSRYKMWQRTEAATWIYSHNNLKHYVIYGCEEITAEMRETGSLDGWTFLYDAHCYKPSGEGAITNEDTEYILNGDEHEIPIEAPPVRYIRIHMLENWSGGLIAQIGEMTFWGQIVKK